MTEPTPATIVVTGSAGRVWSAIADQVAPGRGLRTFDRVSHGPHQTSAHHSSAHHTGDLDDLGVRRELLRGAHALIHLAVSVSPRSSLDACLAETARVCQLIDSAVAAGVRRVIYASSVHAMGLYNRPQFQPAQPEWAPSPCCPYGASKAAAEGYLRYRAHHFDSVIVARLGLTGWGRGAASDTGLYLSDRDAAGFFNVCLDATVVGFSVCFATSANTPARWDLTSAQGLGYRPLDNAADLPPQREEEPWNGVCLLKHDASGSGDPFIANRR